MANISKDKIDQVNQAADIVDVISEYVSLQPSGKSMKGLCPFHSEKTPSFHVSKEKQIFNCFGCHKGGNAITFIQEYKHLDFVEAVRFLADKYNVDLEEDQNEVQKYNYNKLYEVNKLAKNFFNLHLLNLDSGKQALDYLEDRHLTKHVLNEYNIGYAPARNNLLMKNLLENFQEFELVEAGLVNRNDSGNYYDVFRDRVMFPIHNEQGKVIGFSGRTLTNDKNTPKYVNTQATKIFNKGEVLYNLDKALPFVNQKKRVVLMEGFFDVIQASIAGIEESVCTMGTELTTEQARKIKKYTDNVVICYDGDDAGKQATYRALKILENAHLNVQIALMPEGLDPDEYIKKYSQAKFRNQLNQQLIDKFDFVYEMIINKGLKTSTEIETAKNSLFKFLVQTASKTITMIYLQKFAEKIGLSTDVIQQDYQRYLLNQRKYQQIEQTKQKMPVPKTSKARITAEQKLINYYLHSDEYREIIEEDFNNFKFLKGFRFEILITMREIFLSNREVALYNLKTDLSEESFETLTKLLLKENYNYSESELKELIDTLIYESLLVEINAIRDEIMKLGKFNQMDEFPKYKTLLDEKRKSCEIIRRRRNDKKTNI
ncbi:MAG: DNA primase [Tenericutes bacterium]|jgi:DNA primase|nr:DNA primase [Mycoplasmatota bacterium]